MKNHTVPNFIIIDDDAVNNIICKRIIRNTFQHADVKTFTDPEEGLNYLESICSNPELPATVLFLDINMSAFSGWEFLKSFEDLDAVLKKRLTIYMFSSSIDPHDKVLAASNRNIWNYIEKPLTKQIVLDIAHKIREEEQIFFARQIHDKLGQQLMKLKMDILWLDSKIKDPSEDIKEKIASSLVLLNETVETTRQIDAELRPRILDDLGLFAALEWQSAEFVKTTGIKSDLNISFEEPEFSKFLSINIFRIYQETLTNISRHAKAKQVQTEIKYEEGNMIMSIHDNGNGFNTSKTKNVKTLGVSGMKDRASALNGTMKIQSAPHKGTTIILTIPLIIAESK
jgi:signal transduction histidine kinase